MEEEDCRLAQAAKLIAQSSHMVVFTGAGISTPSGIPDFRSPKSGLWEKHDPSEVASIWAFRNHPELFFSWIRSLSIQSNSAVPNQAHQAIADLEKCGVIKAVITQNIDNLHREAGSRNVYELHGSAQSATCQKCGCKHQREFFQRDMLEEEGIPHCSKCGAIIKPDVVLFGENLPEDVWDGAYRECLQADLMLVVGSSLEVFPANTLPETAFNNGAKLIINNLSPTRLDRLAEILLPMDVVEGVGSLPPMVISAAA
jgi:NAD-dependent deacetylase